MKLTVAQLAVISPFFPAPRSGPGKRGRPAKAIVDVLQGILWVLRTGAPWRDMPKQFPSYQTCHRRFQQWVEAGVMQKILRALWDDLRDRGGIADVEAFVDGTYVPAKKGGTSSADAVLAVHPSSWLSRTAMVFHSLSIFLAETATRSDLSRRPSRLVSLADPRGNLSETRLTTALRLFADSANDMLWNSSLLFDEAPGLRRGARMDEPFADTASDGKSNASSPG